jgi:hypothetical protein
VTWKSKKQTMVAQSSAETEYREMSNTTSELTWLQHFPQEIGFAAPTPIPLFCDNQAAIHIASNFVFHERTKHNSILRSIVILFETRCSAKIYLHHL